MEKRERDVVITGMGLITPLGIDVLENRDNFKALRTGIKQHNENDMPVFLQFMGKVERPISADNVPQKLLGQMKFLNRGSLLGFAAAREAMAGIGDSIAAVDPGRRSLYIAAGDTTKVGYDFMYPATKQNLGKPIDYEKLNRSILDKVNPFFLLESINNNLFSFLSAYLGFMGTSTSLGIHSPCGGNALELAWRSIRAGRADIAMAVGCGNWLTEIPMYEMDGIGLLSRCKSGNASFKPFDKKRDGFIPAEGGAALLLESAESADKRGAKVLGRLKGFGNAIEFINSSGLNVPPLVSLKCMQSALQDASFSPEDIAFIIPHGSGSQKGDYSELKSIVELYGSIEKSAPVCGMKPYTGHMGAASDIAELILGIAAINEKIVPATLNFEKTENEFAGLKISNRHQPCDKNSFLSVSYGIGGQSSSVVVQVD
jgi:3-oxoacyl-[acyl-carrier-protein] synthase II